jgi:hypothetical protein
MKVKFCKTEVDYPGEKLHELRDSSDLLNDMSALRTRIKQDGYLLLRNFIDRKIVLDAREAIVNFLDESDALVKGEPKLEAVMPRTGKEVRMTGQNIITH